jgi:NADPH:quinone reductase-like Zn-dependent oxidoreductase
MRAAFVRRSGPAEEIEYGELPTPFVGATDVLVRMKATAVNHVDLFVRSGAYRTNTPFPFVIGRDIVGTVARVGAGVSAVAVGQSVWCNSLGHDGRQGSFAEYAVVPADRLYHLPEGIDPIEAVVVLHAAGTAHIGLCREANLKLGETVFVSGAAGAVGSAVVQLAHAAGARVIATASPRDHEWCRHCGADVVTDYGAPDPFAVVRSAAPDGVDVWWDNSGRHDLVKTLPLMRKGGRVIFMSGMAATPLLPAGELYTRDVSIRGFAISNASVSDLAAAAATTNSLLAAGLLRGRVGTVLPLGDARKAHQLMEQGGTSGRIVITP